MSPVDPVRTAHRTVWTRVVIVVVTLGLAVGTALFTGQYAAGRLGTNDPTIRSRIGQAVLAEGATYRVESLQVAPSFPAEDAGDPAVRGPQGSVIVLAEITQTVVDRTAPLDDQYCDVSLQGADAAWRPDGDFTYGMRRPAVLGCGGNSDHRLRYDRPQLFGVTFVIPQTAAGQLSLRISLRDGADVIEFAR